MYVFLQSSSSTPVQAWRKWRIKLVKVVGWPWNHDGGRKRKGHEPICKEP